MVRSHPPTLLRLAERTLREECDLARGAGVLCAVSGGPDSTALVHALSILGPRLGLGVAAVGVDHGLRAEARSELDSVEALCRTLDVGFERVTVTVAPGSNLQARARQARRAALVAAADRGGFSAIATGHQADDRAETVLLRLLRGAGPRGLAVLCPAAPPWLRPLIRVRRQDVLRHLERHQLAYCTDPSNTDRRFARTRVREEVLPLLQEISPGIVGHLNALADQLAAGSPPPPVLDETGAAVALKRSHVELIQQALSQSKAGARVRIPGGREIVVDGRTGTLDVVPIPIDARRRRP